VPCGLSDGLPVSMKLVGRHFDESTIYRAAHALRAVRRLDGDVGGGCPPFAINLNPAVP
jgi:Asp-tRNA(Asn)/Glu-tRNA(Gln) amidotransferase A subunit family amidase